MNNDILQKYIRGEANQEEKKNIVDWLDRDEKNMQELLLERGIYDSTIWNGSREEYDGYWAPQKKIHSFRRKVIFEFLKIASIFLIALGCYSLFVNPQSNIQDTNIALQTVYAPAGERTELLLSDGTKVWLNAKSKLIFPSQFNGTDRIVELDGEAYFDVAHNDEKKFIVKTETYDIKVYGTEFNVEAYYNSSYFETALIEGSVEITSHKTDERVMLEPEKKVYTNNNKLVLADIEKQDQFLWRNGVLYFENKCVDVILKKLELYYGVTIEVKNQAILSHRYTGKFWTNDGVEHVLKVLQLRHNFKYRKETMNKIIIY